MTRPMVRMALYRAAILLLALFAASPLQAQEVSGPTQQMFDAVLRDDLAAVKRHVATGADISWRNPRGLTAAEFAVEIGHIEIANYLLAEEKTRASVPPRTVAEKSPPKSAKKSEPARAAAAPKAAPADAGPTRPTQRPKTLVERLAGLMRTDPTEPEPATPQPETPVATAQQPSVATQPSPDPSPPVPADAPQAEPSPAERIAARVKERQAAEGKSLPPPQSSESSRPQRSRSFVEWLADTMAGREPREATRPRLPEGLRDPAETAMARAEPPPPDRPTPGVRDPWAPLVAPATPSIAPAPEPAPPSVAALATPESAPLAPAEPAAKPSEAAPGPWAPVVERGGEPEIASAPPSGPAQEPPVLFARRKDSPPGKDSKSPGGLFGEPQKQAPQLGATAKEPARPPAPTAKPAEDKSAEPGEGLWGSKVEMAQARPLVTAPPSAPPVPETVPSGLGFMLGRSLNLDKTTPPRGETQETGRSCIDKSRGQVVFCVEVANWPQAMETDFTVNTILYTGQQAVVRYDRGQATRMQTLFPSESFDKVVAYYAGLYGPPAEYWTRSIAPLASARRENPTRAWRARNPKTGQIATLEIRKFDDTRGGFPDTRRGTVMLYYQEAPPIFPQVSALELMRLKRPHLPPPDAAATPATPVAAGARVTAASGPGPSAPTGSPPPSPTARPAAPHGKPAPIPRAPSRHARG